MKNFRINLAILIGILILGVFVSFPIVSVNNPSNPVEEIKLSDGEITIVTPENKTYTGSMSGFYPGTYGFENDKIGEEPEDWLLFPGDPAMSTEILSELDGHKMVLDMNKGNTYGDNYNLYQYFSEPQVYGAIELWMRTTDALEGSHYHLQNDTTAVWGFGISDNTFNYFEPGVWNPVAFSALSNVWYHIRVEFECGSGNHYGLAEDTWRMFINGVQFGDYNFSIAQTSMKNLRISQNWRYDNYHIYTDAIGYSWNQNYNLGDNLNEGLLLSYDNTTSLIWQGFSIDGLSNKTILGNSTIPLPNDGIHSIQVFGNDSVGTMYESNMRYFTVNTTPYINIITPENKAYTEPMSGFYPATYGFENEMDGTSGTDIDFVDYAGIIADTSISITFFLDLLVADFYLQTL